MPRFSHLVATGACLSVLAIVSCGQAAGGAAGASAAAEPDYAAQVREVIRSHQPDPDAGNAWAAFVRLCQLSEGAVMLFSAEPAVQAWLAEQEPDAYATGTDLLREVLEAPDQVGQAEREAVAAFLAQLERTELFEALDYLGDEGCIVPPVVSPLLTRTYPHLGGARTLATVCGLRMVRAHRAGDEHEVVRALRRLQTIERAASSEMGIVARLVAFAVRALAVETMARMAMEHELSPTLAKRLGEAMDEHDFLPLEMVIETERLNALDTVAHTYARIDGAIAAAGGGGAGLPVPGLKRGSEDEAMEMINTYMDGLREWAGEGGEGAAEREAGMEKMERIYKICEEDHMSPHVTLVGMLLPGRKIVSSARRVEATTAGVRTMLAIEQFEQEHGAPPASLDELVPEYLAAVPSDPFADGAPLGYRTLDTHADEHGRAYLLYTVGADGKDNGGAIAPLSMMNAFTRYGEGFDFVFTNPQWD